MQIASDGVDLRVPKILIVEDEQIVALELQDRIRRMGYEVGGHASAGQEAIAIARQVRPDLVLMDIKLDGVLDGIDAAEAILAENETPVVYLTAFADDSTIERAKKTRPHGYVLKPIKELELRVTIDLALERHRAERTPRENYAWRQALLGSVSEAIIGSDACGLVKYMNPVAEKLTGWPSTQAFGRPVDEVLRIVWTVDGRHKPWSEPLMQELIARDGTRHPVEVSFRPLRAHGASGLVWELRDVTSRKKVQDRHRFLAIASGHVASSLDEATILDRIAPLIAHNIADWCVIHFFDDANGAFVKAVAHRDPGVHALAASFVGSCVSRDQSLALAAVEATGSAVIPRDVTDPTWAAEVLGLRGGPTLRATSALLVPLVARGQPLGTLTLAYERPERVFTGADVSFAEELGRRIGMGLDNAHLCSDAEQAVRSRDDVLALVSDYLRPPITAVSEGASQLLETLRDPSQREAAERQVEGIRREVARMNALVNDLLDAAGAPVRTARSDGNP